MIQTRSDSVQTSFRQVTFTDLNFINRQDTIMFWSQRCVKVCSSDWELHESCIAPPILSPLSITHLTIYLQGTWKGGAKAIKLASLTKLSQTKSVDGKSTVMDYLIQIMTTRAQNGDMGSANALSIDEELKVLHVAKNINLAGTLHFSPALSSHM